MTDSKSYIQKGLETNPLREPLLKEAVQALNLPLGSKGIDAGCGIGLQSLLLAEAVGPDGHVTGLDISPEFLEYADSLIQKSDLSNRISLKQGDIFDLPFSDKTFDWIWSADCAGYPVVADPIAQMRELSRVVKPDGKVAILAYSSQMLLPGYPFLEARLNATCSSYIPYVKGKRPQSNFLRALGWFCEAGLGEPTTMTFVSDVHAPLKDDIRIALLSLIDMLWGEKQSEVTDADWAEFQRLRQPDSSDFILDLSDYYGFFTYSMFVGRSGLSK